MIFENVIEDLKMYNDQYRKARLPKRIFYLIFTQELHAVMIYRFGRWVEYRCKIPIIKQLFSISYFFLRKVSAIFIGVEIWPESEIGPGFKIEHYGGIYIKAKIGEKCRVSQQVVIGHLGGFRGGGIPTLGDNVYVGVGAKILGEIKVGNNAKIGANAVVLNDVPDNAVAVGIPAQIKWSKK